MNWTNVTSSFRRKAVLRFQKAENTNYVVSLKKNTKVLLPEHVLPSSFNLNPDEQVHTMSFLLLGFTAHEYSHPKFPQPGTNKQILSITSKHFLIYWRQMHTPRFDQGYLICFDQGQLFHEPIRLILISVKYIVVFCWQCFVVWLWYPLENFNRSLLFHLSIVCKNIFSLYTFLSKYRITN